MTHAVWAIPLSVTPEASWRLDRLQCLCADKPVSLYGDTAVDRDPAWTLVVTEQRRVVSKRASTPRPKPASGGDSEDSEGDLVPLLCNRQTQEQLLFEKFFGAVLPHHVV